MDMAVYFKEHVTTGKELSQANIMKIIRKLLIVPTTVGLELLH